MSRNLFSSGSCAGYRRLARLWDRHPRRELRELRRAAGVVDVSRGAGERWLPRMAFRKRGTVSNGRDVVVCIFLRGGMDGISAVVPYGEGASYYDLRPTLAVREPGAGTGAAVDLDGFFGLHPSLAGFKDLYTDGKLGIVHGTGCIDPTRSHFDAMRYMEQGVPGDKTVATGWIGRHLESASWTNESPFRAVGMGSLLPASLRGTGAVSALALEDIRDFTLNGRWDQVERLSAELQAAYHVDAPAGLLDDQARLVFETMNILQGLDSENYQPEHGATYPDDYFAVALKQTAQMIKADLGLEVSCIDLGNWDTHETQGTIGGGFAENLKILGDTLLAFYTDLGEAMNSVTVLTMSEFGRRIEENASAGTDHGHGGVMFAMGGGVQGGSVLGTWPGMAEDALDDGDLAITTDQRHILAELLTRRMGCTNLASVFPGFTPQAVGLFKA